MTRLRPVIHYLPDTGKSQRGKHVPDPSNQHAAVWASPCAYWGGSYAACAGRHGETHDHKQENKRCGGNDQCPAGGALLNAARKHATATGARRLELSTAHDNPVRRLYESEGYVQEEGFVHYSLTL